MTTILVVDDNHDNMYVVAQLLRLNGYTVVTAQNGIEALRVIEQHMPDLVLMDLAMPEIDGWTTTAVIKKQPDLAHIPVIAVTSHVMPDDVHRALQVGCQDYVSKPVDFDLLLRKIKSNLLAA